MDFRRFLKEKEFTLEMVADALGISKQAVHQWVTGETLPSKERHKELVKLLGLREDQLPRQKPLTFAYTVSPKKK